MACAKVPEPRSTRRKRFPPLPVPRGAARCWPQVLAAAVVLLVLVPAALGPVTGHHALQAEREAWPTDVNGDPVSAPAGEAPRPVPNQKRAPCTAGLEREISGVCWLATEHKPPACPPQTVAHEGKCLLPVAQPRRLPSSVDGEQQPAP